MVRNEKYHLQQLVIMEKTREGTEQIQGLRICETYGKGPVSGLTKARWAHKQS